MHVDQLWRYPVKSMIGGTVESVRLVDTGIEGDRRWACYDEAAGSVANSRRHGALMQCRAIVDGGRVEIVLPNERTVRSDSPDVDDVLSEYLGRRVTLRSLSPTIDLDLHRRGTPEHSDLMTELRTIFGREGDEPLPDFTKFPPTVGEYETPPGTFHDCYPLLVMTTSALRSLAEALPGSVADVRRFRPSIVLDTGDEPGHPELGWAGRRLQFGDAEIEIVNDCPRCVAVTHAIAPNIPVDRAVLRHVVRDLGQAVGAYARVLHPGVVRVGDAVS